MTKFKPSDFHPFEAYKNEEIRYLFSISLITFAYRNFFGTKQIEKLELTRLFFNSKDYNDDEKKIKFIQDNSDIAFNALIDYIRISISFENYFKSKLLLNEFVIHEIDKNQNENLFKKQKKQPIEITELSLNENKEFTELKETTLNYSLLLNNKNYLKYFMVEESSIDYLKKMNMKRNELHLHMSEKFEFGNSIFDNLEKLKKIVEIDFAVLQNSICDKVNIDNRNKIKVKY